MENLFSINLKERAPLAERMRPNKLSEFVGQEHIVGTGKLLLRAIRAGRLGSCIFWGPPGTGKTTLAQIIANNLQAQIYKLNAVSSGVADAKTVIETAKREKEMYGKQTYLLLDECHRWSKAQSDCILEAMEKGIIYFIGTTTENPYTSMTRAIISRSLIFEFKSLTEEDIITLLKRAIEDKERGLGKYKIEIDSDALKYLARKSAGDSRKALSVLEIAVLSTEENSEGTRKVTEEIIAQSMQSKVLSINADMHYDMLSAFCKSLRGCDASAAVYWSRRLIDSGVDPQIIIRRTISHAAEDVGLCDPQALIISTCALIAYQNMGSPEGEIPITEAIIYVAQAPKNNLVVEVMSQAKNDVQNTRNDAVPDHLKNTNYANEKREQYKYPYLYKDFAANQQYMPNEIKNHNYFKDIKQTYYPPKIIEENNEKFLNKQKVKKEWKNDK